MSDGACPYPDVHADGAWPPAARVHAIHDRYLLEVVEGLGLCPFARRSRELGRVHRPLFWVQGEHPSAGACAAVLLDLVTRHVDAEIILPTFVLPAVHAWQDPERFAEFVPALRAAYDERAARRFFMVAFHPRFSHEPAPHRGPTPESLVPLLRRSPDPVIQCVDAGVLERVRAQAQQTSMTRLRERFADDPVMSAMLQRSVHADSELSADIARTNFAAVGAAPGRDELERILAEIMRDRDARYAR